MLDILIHIWEFLAVLALPCWVGLFAYNQALHYLGKQRSPWYQLSQQRFWLYQRMCLLILLAAEIVILFLHLALTAQMLNTSLFAPVVSSQTFLGSDYGILWLALIVLTCALQGLHWRSARRRKLPFAASQQSPWPLTLPNFLLMGLIFWLELLTFFTPPSIFPASQAHLSPTSTVTSTLSTQTQRVGNFSVILHVNPGKTDVANTVTVQLLTLQNQPVTDARITISVNMEVMNMGTAQTSMTRNTPLYTATFAPYTTFSMSGVWDIKLTIQLPGQTPLATVFTVLFLAH